jgi:DNA-binding LytR/AlgR family response regulator
MTDQKIALKIARNNYVCLALSDIMYLKASRSYTEMVTSSSKIYLLTQSLKAYSENEKLSTFIRANRSVLINPMHLKELITGSNAEITLTSGEVFKPSSKGMVEAINYMDSLLLEV